MRDVSDQIDRLMGKLDEKDRSTSQSIYSSDRLTDSFSLKSISLSDLLLINFPESKWVINKLVSEGGINCISGKPKSGKSFLCLHLAISVASGRKFLGEFDVQQGAVLLVTKEDPRRLIKERVQGFWGENADLDSLPVRICTENNLYLDTDSWLPAIKKEIEERNVKLVIIDSFRRIFKGEENSSQVISEVHSRLKEIQKMGVTIVFVHHHGKEGFFKRDNPDKLRGSSDILAMLDSLLVIDKLDSDRLKISQAVLRSDKPTTPFVVKFDSSSFPWKYEFLGTADVETEKLEEAKKDIYEVLKQGSRHQNELIQAMIETKKYGKTTIKNALSKLEEEKLISRSKEGKEKICQLVDEDDESGQEGLGI
jgi:RecA-family ATPase